MPKKKPNRLRSWAKLPERETRWMAQREALLQAAQRAIHRIGPQISMDEIATEAGITKPILYRHFRDRRGLATALRDQAFVFFLGSEDQNAPGARQAARERVAALYPVVDDPEALRRVLVGFGSGFQMFVELNRNLYRFLRAEGVLDRMWEEPGDSYQSEPVAESLARSFQAIFGKRAGDVAPAIWGHGLRAMFTGIVDWWSESRGCDRFELERQFDVLARAILSGLDQSLLERGGRSGTAASGHAASMARKAGVRRRRRSV